MTWLISLSVHPACCFCTWILMHAHSHVIVQRDNSYHKVEKNLSMTKPALTLQSFNSIQIHLKAFIVICTLRNKLKIKSRSYSHGMCKKTPSETDVWLLFHFFPQAAECRVTWSMNVSNNQLNVSINEE